MKGSTDGSAARTAEGIRTALVVAVAGSAMAALVHAAAVGSHEGDQLLRWMFSLCAAAQLGWAAAVAMRPTRALLGLGVIINGGAVVVWALTRTVGIGFVGSLAEAEAVGAQDLTAAAFAAASVAGVLCILARPVVHRAVTPAWTGLVAAFAIVAALPALGAGHAHVDGDHSHLASAGHDQHEAEGDGHAHDGDDAHAAGEFAHEDGEHAAEGVDHADGEGDGHGEGHDRTADDPATSGHGHADGPAAELASHGGHGSPGTGGGDHPPTTGGHGHPPTTGPNPPTPGPHPHPEDPPATGPIISLDDPRVTAAQRAIAADLIAASRDGLAAFPDVAAVQAAGYISIGDGGTDGYEHFVKWSYLGDAYELDPAHIESIVVKKNGNGTKTIVSAMYILTIGKRMADVPALAGELTTWHDHTNLCFEGGRLVALATGGVCPRGQLLVTPPMLHVWMVAHPCGPFAGIESHGGDCGGHGH